jgi:hypothetical protein
MGNPGARLVTPGRPGITGDPGGMTGPGGIVTPGGVVRCCGGNTGCAGGSAGCVGGKTGCAGGIAGCFGGNAAGGGGTGLSVCPGALNPANRIIIVTASSDCWWMFFINRFAVSHCLPFADFVICPAVAMEAWLNSPTDHSLRQGTAVIQGNLIFQDLGEWEGIGVGDLHRQRLRAKQQ